MKKKWNQNVNAFIVTERKPFVVCPRSKFCHSFVSYTIKLQTLIYLFDSRTMHTTSRRHEWCDANEWNTPREWNVFALTLVTRQNLDDATEYGIHHDDDGFTFSYFFFFSSFFMFTVDLHAFFFFSRPPDSFHLGIRVTCDALIWFSYYYYYRRPRMEEKNKTEISLSKYVWSGHYPNGLSPSSVCRHRVCV